MRKDTTMTVDPSRKNRMRLDDKTRAELCFLFAVIAAVYAIIVLAAHGMTQGWW